MTVAIALLAVPAILVEVARARAVWSITPVEVLVSPMVASPPLAVANWAMPLWMAALALAVPWSASAVAYACVVNVPLLVVIAVAEPLMPTAC